MPAVEALTSLGEALLRPGILDLRPLLLQPRDALRSELTQLRKIQREAADVRATLSVAYRETVLREDLRQISREWREACAANLLLRRGRQHKVRQRLESHAPSGVQGDIGPDIERLIRLQELDEAAQRLGVPLAIVGSCWSGSRSDADAIERQLDGAATLREKLVDLSAPIGVLQLREHVAKLLDDRPQVTTVEGPASATVVRLRSSLDEIKESVGHLLELAGITDPSSLPLTGTTWVASLTETIRRWQQHINLARTWVPWQTAAAKARAVGLAPLVDALSAGSIKPHELETAFEVSHARWWTDRLVTSDPVLRRFLAERHESTIARFRAVDARVCELAGGIVRSKLSGGIPGPNAFGTDPQWGALARELTKRARLMPLRQLFARIPDVLTRLTPCVMMSPLSIAQYLPAGAAPFDLVVFDEASQVPVWDAIGAIARGKQVVIVGDPEQLPPTSIGERGVDEIEDGTDVSDQESILDECLAANIPQRRLAWHYRSRHESLIAFSNRAYYDERLVTFPSSLTDDRAVQYVHVPDGVYQRGSGRINKREAERVVEETIRRLREPSFAREQRSLGIVTFNGEQQRLIENLLDKERRGHPELERYFDSLQWQEPVFVKNLENVQGDERDVILFSVAVAPEEKKMGIGQISSLNKDGGHRRLNVAITRARREMIVFATLRPEQIDLSRTKARGVRDFKHFLEFADRGSRALSEAASPSGRGAESPFEEAVKYALENAGWVVHTQVGVSAFRIDLAVVHPDAPGRYLAGVECDGASYHRSATARDRDRLREMVLTDLGWRIQRVWSTEWWHDADVAAARLHAALETDLTEDRRCVAEAAAVAEQAAAASAVLATSAAHSEESLMPEPLLVDEDVGSRPVICEPMPPLLDLPLQRPNELPLQAYSCLSTSRPLPERPWHQAEAAGYQAADFGGLGLEIDSNRFYEPLYRDVLRRMVAHVVEVEGPIFDDVLVRRIARAHGFQRAGAKIREMVMAAVPRQSEKSIEEGRQVIWPPTVPPAPIVAFRRADPELRDQGDIPMAELADLARACLDAGADEEASVRRLADILRIGRLRESTKIRLKAAVKLALEAI